MNSVDQNVYHYCKIFSFGQWIPKGYFGASNGLRQGDPLSPLLFIVATHILNRMLALGSDNQLINGIQFPHSRPSVTNIQYADDTLIFITPSVDNVVKS